MKRTDELKRMDGLFDRDGSGRRMESGRVLNKKPSEIDSYLK
jgi:hypothetical protein